MNKIWFILLTLAVVLLAALSGKFTDGYFIDVENSTDNVLRVKIAPLFGAADSFAVLAYSGITNTGISAITGDVGSYPTGTVTGLTADMVTGTLFTTSEVIVGTAKTDLTTAYNDAAGRTPFTTITGDTLGGLNLDPGFYGGGALDLTGTLTLTGDANAVWIFKAASTLNTAGGSQIILSGGARACNVYWVIGSSATLGANSVFKGNIMALASITMYAGAELEGRVLAQTAAVTLNGNIINRPYQ